MAASEAAARSTTQAQTAPRPAASVRRRSWTALILALIALAAGSVWFGYLDNAGADQGVKLEVALALTVLGLATVLLVRLLGDRDDGLLVDVTRTVLALLSMTAALIHFAVVAEYLSEYWLYLIVVGIVLLIIGARDRRSVPTATGDVLSGLAALLVVPVSVLSLYSAVAGHPFVSHVG